MGKAPRFAQEHPYLCLNSYVKCWILDKMRFAHHMWQLEGVALPSSWSFRQFVKSLMCKKVQPNGKRG